MKSQNSCRGVSCSSSRTQACRVICDKIERRSAVGVEQIENGDQHKERTDHRVQDELDCGIDPVARLPRCPMRKYMGISMTSQKT